jgi:hypothetical protein
MHAYSAYDITEIQKQLMLTVSLIKEMLEKSISVINSCILIKQFYTQEILMSIISQCLWTN